MNMENFVPAEALAFVAMARSKKAQGSLEYIMMIAAASIVIVLAIAAVAKLKNAAISSMGLNGTNGSVASAISKELGSLARNVT